MHAAGRWRGAVGRSRPAAADVVRAVRLMVRALHGARRQRCDTELQQSAHTAGTKGRAAEMEDRRLVFDGIIGGSVIATMAARPAPDQHFPCNRASAASSSATPQRQVDTSAVRMVSASRCSMSQAGYGVLWWYVTDIIRRVELQHPGVVNGRINRTSWSALSPGK